MPLQDAYQSLNRYFIFEDRDQHAWWTAKAPLLGQMLQDCGYPESEQYQYLCFFALHLVPALGPYAAQSADGEWKSLLSGSGRLEFSLTYDESRGWLRIAFEPTSYRSGTEYDRFNKRHTMQLLSALQKLDIGIDTTLYHSLFTNLIISDSEEATLNQQKTAAELGFKTQNILALDLKDSTVRAELYVYPHLKSLASGVPSETLLWNAIRSVDSSGRFVEASEILKDFLTTQLSTTNLMFLSSDLVAPDQAFHRLFAAESQFTMKRIEDLWTLQGVLGDTATSTGLKHLQELWRLLDLSEGPKSKTHFPLLFTYELLDVEPFVVPKIGIPAQGLSELTIARVVADFFAYLGWTHHASRHVENTKAYYDHIDLTQHAGKQAWLAFSYNGEMGPRLAVHHY